MTRTDDPFERWPELDQLFAKALETQAAEREAFLTTACANDRELRRELDRLLAAHAQAGEFLERPDRWLAGLVPAAPAVESTVPPAWLGGHVSHYEIVEPLAAGGMGVVFKARDTKLDRSVTLKFLQPHLGREATAAARFVQEAQAASALDHPNICTIYEIDETEDGQRFIAMAYYPGETLKERLARGPLALDHALDVARQIGAGLARAHEAGIVHRDLKPANVMLTDRGEVKILDFGIAKLGDSAAEITKEGARLGTVAYMSPEQARGDTVDHRTDVWSLGVVLWEMLTGERPFQGANEQAVIYAILHAAVPPRPDGMPAALADVIATALAKDPNGRFSDMSRLLGALAAIGAKGGRRVQPAHRTRRRGRLVLRAGAVLALAVLVMAGVALLGRGTAAPGSAADLPRLVVLPFDNLGPAEDEYFAEGITDEIVARLARVRGLAVLARQSALRYRDSPKSPEEIGAELAVDYILEATISWQRQSDGPSRVRVRPQLIRVADGTHVWAEVLDEDLTGVFDVQRRIAEEVVRALGIALVEPERRAIARRPTTDLKAYDHFLRGNHFILRRTQESVTRAIQEYRAAVELDPRFADAQARIAYAIGLFADWGWDYPGVSADSLLELGFDAVDRALQLNPQSADAWMSRAYLLAFRHPDTYEGVPEAFQQALQYDPNNAEAHHQYASMIVRLGMHEEAEVHFHRALALEPTLAIAYVNMGFDRFTQGRFTEALMYLDSAIVVDPLSAHAYEHRAQVRSHLGQHREARVDAELAIEATDGALGRTVLALVAARGGDTAEARDQIAEVLRNGRPLHKEGRLWLITAMILVGDVDAGLKRLAAERPMGQVYLRYLTRSPDFESVRDDPRFRAVVGTD